MADDLFDFLLMADDNADEIFDYINLADGTDIDAFHAEVQEMFADDVNSVI